MLLPRHAAVIAISIHALVKRATTGRAGSARTGGISIHALVKRATEKCRLKHFLLVISIHALVKRATGVSEPV